MNKERSESSFSFKIVLVGDVGVGKTSLFLRLRDDKFYGSKMSTIGIDSCSKTLRVDDKEVKLKILDTAGIERFRTLTNSYYRDSKAVFCVYSVDDLTTFTNLRAWHQEVRKYAPIASCFLIGNKNDLESKVSKDMVEHIARRRGYEVAFSVSAKTGQGVHSFLETVCKKLISEDRRNQEKKHSWPEQNICVNDGNDPINKTSSCCF